MYKKCLVIIMICVSSNMCGMEEKQKGWVAEKWFKALGPALQVICSSSQEQREESSCFNLRKILSRTAHGVDVDDSIRNKTFWLLRGDQSIPSERGWGVQFLNNVLLQFKDTYKLPNDVTKKELDSVLALHRRILWSRRWQCLTTSNRLHEIICYEECAAQWGLDEILEKDNPAQSN